MMNTQDKNKLIKQIEQRVIFLKQELLANDSLSVKKQIQSDDSSANLDLTIGAPVDETVYAGHRKELAELVKSFEWLNSEDAGYCELCGNTIPVARLEVVPHSRSCIECAAKQH
ncbi:TraR/DksA C4-type zinc finger protein [Dasania sp. GY-MA-18]|uniref:TraR/DksA C4-type zinc finger protein n=1 Tax=Dasania phycosphaerae TaxID=2950436 RepID=A0A9J6RGX6_9GAMM|nr:MULTISPECIES: TraR/DksA C4-type zinc finger protein [Dasania]MCR8921288.1 TraR/DksA C4-type zinc finger protein [Dasania sp. GY-MA-18]MCZ0863716.1 TraR/DksA C4-type zinc finger protein [Dasania phycosphaerae]MCZ0867444.1 TraR/DksA C4-type zinc finger protein [Dasania phycosphaerae]